MNRVNKLLRQESIWIPVISIVIGIVIGAIVMLIGGYDPLLAYSSLIDKIFGSVYDIGETLRSIVPLILSGLAVAIAFRGGMFNIGVEGQIVMGSLGALMVGNMLELPPFIHGIVAILVGTLFGGIWGALVAIFKVKRGLNEVISCIMLNWIALYISHIAIKSYMVEAGTSRSQMIRESADIQIPWLSDLLSGARIHWGFFIVIFILIGYYYYMNRTKKGYEIRAVGYNRHAAEYAGMNVSKIAIRTFFISGALGGLIGTFEVLGVFKYMAITPNTSGIGFDGIAVALLGMNTAVGVTLSAALFGGLYYGAQGMSFGADVPPEVIKMVISIIIFFAAAPGAIRMFIKMFKRKSKREEG
ncbi:ABC transporter permease [Paenibacillus popilliae]|uniref:ABC transporter permease n=1 Tax=Paenibacillus popilliae TaxID=78057 RepID=A0ABY3AJ12_PAEPP|nr:ABC transporter permease [Paenibacillus sp. SDF0028]TQR41740.1 ABC transporter permease [Paenibacillus sp. SDF0028]